MIMIDQTSLKLFQGCYNFSQKLLFWLEFFFCFCFGIVIASINFKAWMILIPIKLQKLDTVSVRG